MIYDVTVNCNSVDTPWQQCSTHLHTNSTQYSSAVHIYTQTVRSTAVQYTFTHKQYTVQQYSTHLHTNSTQYSSAAHIYTQTAHSTAVQHTFTHKQYTVQQCSTHLHTNSTQYSSAVHIYTQTVHRMTQLTTLVGRLSGIRTQSGQNKIDVELTA